MPQRDLFHASVRSALVKDGWTITHDPLVLPYGTHRLYVDLGAEQVLAAERGADRIAVSMLVFDPDREEVTRWLR